MTLASNVRATDEMRNPSHSAAHNEIVEVLTGLGLNVAASPSNTAAQNEAAWGAALALIEDEGGELIIPPGQYQGQLPPITGLGHVRISGYGATLFPEAGEAGITINQGVSSFVEGVVVEGLKIDGSAGSVTGVLLKDTNNAVLRDCYIRDCATGVDFHSAEANGFVEGTQIWGMLMRQNTTGLHFRTTNGTASFAQTNIYGLRCVVGTGGTGLIVEDPCVLQRSFVQGLFFVGDGETAVNIDGSMDDADWFIAIEGEGGSTSSTGLVVGANAADLSTWDLRLKLTGTITLPLSTSAVFNYDRGGREIVQTSGTATISYQRHGDVAARYALEVLNNGPRITGGSGAGARDVNFYRNAANQWMTDDQLVCADGVVTRVVAGAVTDAAFTVDTNGLIAIDSSNGRIYVRYGGAWHYATLDA